MTFQRLQKKKNSQGDSLENIAYLQNNSLTFQRRSDNGYHTSKVVSLGIEAIVYMSLFSWE